MRRRRAGTLALAGLLSGAALLWAATPAALPPAVLPAVATPPKPAAGALVHRPLTTPRPALAEPAPPSATTTAAGRGDREQATARIQVTVRIDPELRCSMPVAELLRVGDDGSLQPLATGRDPHPLPELVERLARGLPLRQGSEATRTFEVSAPGRYRTAWHLWQQVPGTRVWRVCRGRGPELAVGAGDILEVVLDLGRDDLQLDPALDRPAADPHYRFTAKDGE